MATGMVLLFVRCARKDLLILAQSLVDFVLFLPQEIIIHKFDQLWFLQFVLTLHLLPLPLFNFFVMYIIL